MIRNKNFLRLQAGQAIIVVLLIIVVALTIGLSVTMRSVKDIKMSTRTEESQRAFSAAEAGLEAALLSGGNVNTTSLGSGGDLDYTATVSEVGGGSSYVFPDKIERDDTQQIWFVSHNPTTSELELICPTGGRPCYSGNSIDIYWGDDATDNPAIEASLIYVDNPSNPTYKIKKFAYDSNTGRATQNSFTDCSTSCSGGSIGSKTFLHITILNFSLIGSEKPIALRLRYMYNNNPQILGVKVSGGTLAYQGQEYKSMGTARVSGSVETETRTISFIKSYPTLPGIFDFALFSNSSLSK